jgi:hypothetical protein
MKNRTIARIPIPKLLFPVAIVLMPTCLVLVAWSFLPWKAGLRTKGTPPRQQTVPQVIQKPAEPPVAPVGLLEKNTVFAVYGRAFGRAEILGHLGTYKNYDSMEKDIPKWLDEIKKYNDDKPILPAIDLIYALAIPCKKTGDCLQYLEGSVELIEEKYIQPAADRGWLVFLDTQLGRSNPVAQVNRLIEQGYLKYDNVHVAVDPEFHVQPGKMIPGIPIGTIPASQINEAQKILDDYVTAQHLKTKKILVVHQFIDLAVNEGGYTMISNKKDIKAFPNVELVFDADGLGSPELKTWKYNRMTDPQIYPFLQYRGFKVFYPNPWEKRGHFDKPPMTMEQVFGLAPVAKQLRMTSKPNIVIIA